MFKMRIWFLVLSVNFAFAQCPQLANVEVEYTNISCFGKNDGTIKVSLKDSASLSTNKFYFVLYAWGGSGLTKRQTVGVASPKYNATFTGLTEGNYDVLIARTAGTNTCTAFPLFSGNNAVTSIANTNTTYKPAFVNQMNFASSIQILQPASSSAGNYSPDYDISSVLLSANDPAPSGFPASMGTWSVASGANIPRFSDVHDPNAIVSDLLPGEYIFNWTLTRPGCPDRSSLAFVSVEVLKPIQNDFDFKKKTTKIVGTVFYDHDKNGKKDTTEDFVANHAIITNKEGFGAFTDDQGRFELVLTEAGSYEIGLKPKPNFDLSPTLVKSYGEGDYDSLIFYLSPQDILKSDLKADITPIYPFARPNQPYVLQAEVSNMGDESTGGELKIDLPKEFVLDSVPGIASKGNVYAIDSLLPSRMLRFLVYGHIAKGIPIGNKITFLASINSNLPDADESDNQSTTTREIVDFPVNERTEASSSTFSNNIVLVQIDTLSVPQIQNHKELT